MIEGSVKVQASDKVKMWIITVIIAAAGLYFIAMRGEFNYLDYLSLVIHEAGHWLLSWCGETITVLGGTITQLLVPVLLIVFAFYNRFRVVLQLSLLLLVQNSLNISNYVADAQTKKLQLFGGPAATHDWNFLLTKYDVLAYDADIAMGFVVLAGIALILIVITPIVLQD